MFFLIRDLTPVLRDPGFTLMVTGSQSFTLPRFVHINRDTKTTVLPALTIDLLKEKGFSAENVFTELWRRIGVKTILNRSGFAKRSGASIHKVVYALSLWLWLKKESIGMFAREDLQGMGKDVLYDTMNREDLNWRRLFWWD